MLTAIQPTMTYLYSSICNFYYVTLVLKSLSVSSYIHLWTLNWWRNHRFGTICNNFWMCSIVLASISPLQCEAECCYGWLKFLNTGSYLSFLLAECATTLTAVRCGYLTFITEVREGGGVVMLAWSENRNSHQSTIPSPTDVKRESVLGSMGRTCWQSGSFSSAVLIQFTKAYRSSSVRMSIHRPPVKSKNINDVIWPYCS